MGSNDNLENLLRSGGLKAEPPDRKECEGLLRSAIDRLQDAQLAAPVHDRHRQRVHDPENRDQHGHRDLRVRQRQPLVRQPVDELPHIVVGQHEQPAIGAQLREDRPAHAGQGGALLQVDAEDVDPVVVPVARVDRPVEEDHARLIGPVLDDADHG